MPRAMTAQTHHAHLNETAENDQRNILKVGTGLEQNL